MRASARAGAACGLHAAAFGANLSLALAVAAISLVAYWSTLQAPISADASSQVQTAFSFVRQGNADIDEYVDLGWPLGARRERIGDHWYAPYTTGDALLFTPFALVADHVGVEPTTLAGVSTLPKMVASIFVAASVAFVFLALRLLVPARPAIFITLAYSLGSNAFAGASQQYLEHAASMMLGSAGVLIVLRGGRGAPAAAGMTLGIAGIVRPTNALLFLAVLGWLAAERGRSAATRYILWSTPALAFQGTIGALAFGSPFVMARGQPQPGSIVQGMLGQLISPSRGLLVYYPWVILALAALIASWLGPADRPRRLLRVILLVFIGMWVVTGGYRYWWAGYTFGNRYMSDLAPMYALAVADGWRRGWLKAWVPRAMLSVAVGWSILLQAVGAGLFYFTWHGHQWDATPSIDDTPWRLWSWTDTQWQFVLRRFVNDPGPAMIVEGAVVLACITSFAILASRAGPDRPGSARTSP